MNMHNDRKYKSGRIRAALAGAILTAAAIVAFQNIGKAQASQDVGASIRVTEDTETGVSCYYFDGRKDVLSCVQTKEGKAPL